MLPWKAVLVERIWAVGLVAGKRVDYPPAGQVNQTFKKAGKVEGGVRKFQSMLL